MKIMVSAYLDNNIGDDLMIFLLADKYKEHMFLVYTDKSVIVNTFSKLENIIVKSTKEIKKDIRDIDVYLSIGGSIFNDLNNWKGQILRVKRILTLKKLKKKNIKIVTMGCNLGPYNNKIGLLLTKLELKLNNLISVRDISSFNIIKNFKSIKNFYLADDIVYNLNYENYGGLKSQCLGISAYRSLIKSDYNMENYKFLAAIADNYIEKTGNIVKLFAFDSENENDLVDIKSKVQIIPYLGDHDGFIRELNRCNRFIAIRFHSAILCDIFKIPFLPVVYSNKLKSLLDDNDYEGVQININDLNSRKHSVLKITDAIINAENLFEHTNETNYKSSNIHFDEFSKLLSE